MQAMQISTASQRLILPTLQETQAPAEVQVWPALQQPSAVLGRRLNVALQRTHFSATSHRSQFKLAEQATQPAPLELRVKPVLQITQELGESQRLQLDEVHDTQPTPPAKFQV